MDSALEAAGLLDSLCGVPAALPPRPRQPRGPEASRGGASQAGFSRNSCRPVLYLFATFYWLGGLAQRETKT